MIYRWSRYPLLCRAIIDPKREKSRKFQLDGRIRVRKLEISEPSVPSDRPASRDTRDTSRARYLMRLYVLSDCARYIYEDPIDLRREKRQASNTAYIQLRPRRRRRRRG